MRKTLKMFAGFLGVAVLFVQPVMATENILEQNRERSKAIVSALNVEEDSLRVESSRLQAIQILLESNRRMAEQSSYQLDGTVFTKQIMHVEGEEPITTDIVLDMRVAFESPDTVYMKAVTESLEEKHIVDVFFEDGVMYVKVEEEAWMRFGAMDSASIISDTTKLLTAEQMKSLFNQITYVEEEMADGNRFHHIGVEVNNEKFKEMMLTDVASLQAQADFLMTSEVVDVLNNMESAMQYIYVIDADSLLVKDVLYRMEMKFAMDIEGTTVGFSVVSNGMLAMSKYGEEGLLEAIRSLS